MNVLVNNKEEFQHLEMKNKELSYENESLATRLDLLKKKSNLALLQIKIVKRMLKEGRSKEEVLRSISEFWNDME